jgi:hypothetical protein
MLRTLIWTTLLLACVPFPASPRAAAAAEPAKFDVVIYGETPGGIATAIAVARRDKDCRVALVSPYRRIGGMVTNGLTHPDFRTFESRTGLFREFNQRVERYFREKYGDDSVEVRESLFGTHAGPELNHAILRQMLDELPGITVLTRHQLVEAEQDGRRLKSVRLRAPEGTVTIAGRYFVDATYEGDLLAAAGVPFRVGREGRSEYGESLAPAEPDNQLQGYNFRLTMTDRPENMAPVPKPDGYRREDYLELLPLLERGAVKRVFGDPYMGLDGGMYKRQTPPLPEGKRDINDVSHSIVRLSLPGRNTAWPEGDEKTRQRIFDEHLRHNVGLLYFLQHDDAVPPAFREDARSWGLCRDEYVDNQHLPEQLYVREARRMVGRYVFTQRDTERAPDTGHARAIFHPDSIAMGDYGPNCHGTAHQGPLFGGKHTGEFYQKAAPYQIPYGTLLPREIDNLAAPVACSSSHVGFCALRLEPIWMSLGQAAGEATALALKQDESLAEIKPAVIRRRLHEARAATIYVADVPEESPDFAAVQWWGSEGGLIDLDRSADEEPADYGRRGKQRVGQYHEAFPEHGVALDKPLDERLRTAWLKLAERIAPTATDLQSAATRGDFIRRAWRSQGAK